ncbi:MAG: undecaprenyl/decaprenyl-phosphate alpha-N-acetylglucosaminyl 1-phosphate transferase [Bacteroidales bacterium]|nr:undecaprenyl/decaprenyl-phosphate alpha-N-acetylglucosaminyl 1-phosphate transferase [Bacteroidales bacterium]
MSLTQIAFVLMLVAFVVTMLVYPLVLSFARKHNIVDNPDARKLQREPVPIMGGAAVCIGFMTVSLILFAIVGDIRLLWALLMLTFIYAIGLWDDLRDISPALRFILESVLVWIMIPVLGIEINDFHGLWGLHVIPEYVSVPLTLVAGVGIINSVNLIDGVDGYCSSFGMMACSVFAVLSYYSGDYVVFCVALFAIGALLPFFLHNVFGYRSKMFLGDGGSLMLGTMLTMIVFRTLTSGAPCAVYENLGLSLPAICLAIMAVPVFDTLKVMTYRLIRGVSPFQPDKNHLHHMFIDVGYTHLATSVSILIVNFVIIAVTLFSWRQGASIDMQAYLVIGMGLLLQGFYFFVHRQKNLNNGEGSAMYRRWCSRSHRTNLSNTKWWRKISKTVDGRFLGGSSFYSDKESAD